MRLNIKKVIKWIGALTGVVITLAALVKAVDDLDDFKTKFLADECDVKNLSPIGDGSSVAKREILSDDALYERMRLVDVGATTRYINSLFGEPYLVRRLPKCLIDIHTNDPIKVDLENFIERIYTDEKFYLQTISGEDGELVAYSITTKDDSFNPQVPLEIYHAHLVEGTEDTVESVPYITELALGKASFSDLKDTEPSRVGFGGWNQHTSYLEQHYFGRPGKYKDYFFGVSPYGVYSSSTLYSQMAQLAFQYMDEQNIEDKVTYSLWRKADKINTFAVVDGSKNTERLVDYFFYYGIGPNIEVIYKLNN